MSSNMTLTLKLTIDKKANKVLFGEANKDLVDFLFSIMSLPVGSLITSLSKQNMVGCLGELYGSIEKLNATYIQPNRNKDSILQAKAVQFPLLISDVVIIPTATSYAGKSFFYSCDKCSCYVTDVNGSLCPNVNCKGVLSNALTYHKPPAVTRSTSDDPKGYVQRGTTYLVMDDLAVIPMSTNSFITLMNQFNVQDVGALEERVVNFGMEEGMILLKASLRSKTVLTDLFLQSRRKLVNDITTRIKKKKKLVMLIFFLFVCSCLGSLGPPPR